MKLTYNVRTTITEAGEVDLELPFFGQDIVNHYHIDEMETVTRVHCFNGYANIERSCKGNHLYDLMLSQAVKAKPCTEEQYLAAARKFIPSYEKSSEPCY